MVQYHQMFSWEGNPQEPKHTPREGMPFNLWSSSSKMPTSDVAMKDGGRKCVQDGRTWDWGGQWAQGIHPERDSEGMFPMAKAHSCVSEWKFLFVCIFHTACIEGG